MNQAEAQPGDSDGSIHHPGKKKNPIFRVVKGQPTHSYLRSVDFDGNVVALRRPLGSFGHFETSTNEVDAELALAGDIGHELPFIHQRASCLHERAILHLRLTNLWTFGRAVTVSRCGEGNGTAERSLGKPQICDWKPAEDTQKRVTMRPKTAAVYK